PSPALSSDCSLAIITSRLYTAISMCCQHARYQRARCPWSRSAIGRASYAPGHIPSPGGLHHAGRVPLLGQRLPIGGIGTIERHTEWYTGRHQHLYQYPRGDSPCQKHIPVIEENNRAPNTERDERTPRDHRPSWSEVFRPYGRATIK